MSARGPGAPPIRGEGAAVLLHRAREARVEVRRQVRPDQRPPAPATQPSTPSDLRIATGALQLSMGTKRRILR